MDINPGDAVVVKQDKTVLNPPGDPKHYEVTKMAGTKVFLQHNGKQKIRSKDKCKVIKKTLENNQNTTLLSPINFIHHDQKCSSQ